MVKNHYQRSANMPETYYLSRDKYHFLWNSTKEPALKVKSGDTVVMETPEVSDDQITHNSTTEVLDDLDWDRFYPLSGPIYVEDAEPGDTLAVEILNIQHAGWGWGAVLPNLSLLENDFDKPYLRIFDLSDGDYIHFRKDIKIPIEPSLGTMGVCPKGSKDLSPLPPRKSGGNIDIRYLKKGSTLYLPVQEPGALFACTDGHTAIGDGEVSGTGVETQLNVSFKFTLLKEKQISTPQFKTEGELTPKVNDGNFYGTTGVSNDLYKASQEALREMINYLSQTYNMSKDDAFLLSSLCVDLKSSEIVNDFVVSAVLPLTIFNQ